MHDCVIFPFVFDSLQENQTETQFEGCDWLQDWGPYKKGDRTGYISVDFNEGILIEWTQDGKIIRRMKFKCSFIEEIPLEQDS